MPTKTQAIRSAFKRYALAYQDYHRLCKQIEIVVKQPRIYYLPGSGYEINGKLQKSTADDIIAALNANTQECIEQAKRECGDLSFDAANPVANAKELQPTSTYITIYPPLLPIPEEETREN